MNLERLKNWPVLGWLYRQPILISAYHYVWALLAAIVFGFPSRKLHVIGVTGTKGKTTTANLIAQILAGSGHPTGLATTVLFRIKDKEWVNDSKQTMLGRFGLQQLLRQMVKAGCEYAVIETSSEGIAQHRHRFIHYQTAVFTNLSPEHIERHGSFENYRSAKLRLFEKIAEEPQGTAIYNLDDPEVEHFFGPKVDRRYGFALKTPLPNPNLPEGNQFRVEVLKLEEQKSEFRMAGEKFQMPLLGRFNVANAAAAVCVAISRNIPKQRVREILSSARSAPGRFEVIEIPKGIRVVIDYAHEPASLGALYEAVRIFSPKRIIGILGSQGGGRDRWKRSAMGEIAGQNSDELILTAEDPYDEDPMQIASDIEQGIKMRSGLTVRKIMDRREAIRSALQSAKAGEVVVISGKGGEVSMCVARGQKIPWSDRGVVEELIQAGAN